MDSVQNKLEIGDLTHVTTYQAGVLQASASRALRLFCNEVLKPYGITKRQWLVIGLAIDAGKDGAKTADLARQLDMTPRSLTSLLTTLEKRKKIIYKSSSQKTVTIHPDFQPDCLEIEEMMRVALRTSIYNNITPLEFRVYLKVLFFISRLQPSKF